MFVAPLLKRDGGSFIGRITLGRTRNNDVVLRDKSVSKFHASLEPCGADSLSVLDARSTNGTHVNGDPITGSTIVTPGDAVRFGSVETFLCSSTGLWACLAET